MSKSFCKKVASSGPATLLKRDSDKNIFQQISESFYEQARLRTTAWNEVSKQYFLLKIIEIKIKQLKLKRAKIYIQENQIQLINSHEIYHLHFLKERQHAGETREPKTTYSANEYLEWI